MAKDQDVIETESLSVVRKLIGKEVAITIDRPIGSRHPIYNFEYKVNYGYISEIMAPDNEELYAYYLGVEEPLQKALGTCIAIVHRVDDGDNKLVVVPKEVELTDEEIIGAIQFQEQWFNIKIIRWQ